MPRRPPRLARRRCVRYVCLCARVRARVWMVVGTDGVGWMAGSWRWLRPPVVDTHRTFHHPGYPHTRPTSHQSGWRRRCGRSAGTRGHSRRCPSTTSRSRTFCCRGQSIVSAFFHVVWRDVVWWCGWGRAGNGIVWWPVFSGPGLILYIHVHAHAHARRAADEFTMPDRTRSLIEVSHN